jgi:cytochrome b pre-mRNA-processing protein 3
MVFNWLKNRRKAKENARSLYFAAATQARNPAFYTDLGVPDSFDGRFEMTSLHIFLIMNALTREGPGHGKRLSQALFDRMFKVTDQAIREMGIGDLGVPRHMKRMMKAFNGRAHAYRAALAQGDDTALIEALRRNVYGTLETPQEGHVSSLAAYVRQAAAGVNAKAALDGQVDFPDITFFNASNITGEKRYG